MKAIVLKAFGGPENLIFEELAMPAINDTEVLVQVKAISINPVDVKTRMGKGLAGRLKDINPLILGWDISGVITETGSSVTQFKKGDEVFGMINFPGHGRAYAEYVAAPASDLALKPANIPHTAAAAATLAALTAWQAVCIKGHVKAGDKVLIHAAAGGVGHYAVQIAKYLGAYVIGTSSAVNKDFVLELGADEHLDYKKQRIEEIPRHIDFVLDAIGGENIDRSLEVIRPGGTIISIPSGLSESVTAKAKAHGINGYFFLVSSSGEDMNSIAGLLQKGIIKSHIFKTFAFHEMAAAHSQIETGTTRGKVVITIADNYNI